MKKIGIGYEFFKDFTNENLYYVDKTLLIKDLIDKGGKVTLFTRPRRFGKTLALSMLRTFFELEYDRDGNVVDNSRYFAGMKIMAEGDEILSMMGQYPVINMSLKSAKQGDFYGSFIRLREEIIGEFSRHSYVLKSDKLPDESKEKYMELLNGLSIWNEKEKKFADRDDWNKGFKQECAKYASAIKTLSECLKLYHDRDVIILIDEYDVPLENAYLRGFYETMADFIRALFESALKTNDSLKIAVVTGCLRISKESIFTGLNNLVINSINSINFGEYFGFTQEETLDMLGAYGLDKDVDTVMKWYDGYLFGGSEVYNPWSVTYYVYDHVSAPDCFAKPYWANTSSNSIIKELIEGAGDHMKAELENLISGGTIEKKIHEDITYEDIHDSEDNLWNFLFFTGYLKKVSERQEGKDIYLTMRIPNYEIGYIYENQIAAWFDRVVRLADRSDLYKSVVKKDIEEIARILSMTLRKSISTFDNAESFYHGFLLSMLIGIPDYEAKSNREEGDGRPDIVLYPLNPGDPAYIFEIKTRRKYNEMDDGIQEAFGQIREKKYEEGILDDGYAGVISYGVCFCKKSCAVGLHQR